MAGIDACSVLLHARCNTHNVLQEHLNFFCLIHDFLISTQNGRTPRRSTQRPQPSPRPRTNQNDHRCYGVENCGLLSPSPGRDLRANAFAVLPTFSYQPERLQALCSFLPERRRNWPLHAYFSLLRGDEGRIRCPAPMALHPEGLTDPSGPKQGKSPARHQDLPAGYHQLVVPAARERAQRCHRVPAFPSSLRAARKLVLHRG